MIMISLSEILALGNKKADIEDLKEFIYQRMKVFLREKELRHDIIDACLSIDKEDDLALSVKKSFALMEFIKTSDGSNLIQGFNISEGLSQNSVMLSKHNALIVIIMCTPSYLASLAKRSNCLVHISQSSPSLMYSACGPFASQLV
mgnify:CR=1 FL=1